MYVGWKDARDDEAGNKTRSPMMNKRSMNGQQVLIENRGTKGGQRLQSCITQAQVYLCSLSVACMCIILTAEPCINWTSTFAR